LLVDGWDDFANEAKLRFLNFAEWKCARDEPESHLRGLRPGLIELD
jgi:hypothetical protein